MGFLREIQNDAAGSHTDVATLLMKCKLLAARLRSDGFAFWVDLELRGYPEEQAVPDYRTLVTGWWAQFIGAGMHVPRTPIPEGVFPVNLREWYRSTPIRDGIAAIAACTSGRGIRFEHPELVPCIQGAMYPTLNCVEVWSEISSHSYLQLVSMVRSRILDFVIDLERENPDAGEASPNSKPIAEDKLQPLVNNYFGPVGNIAQASHGFNQTATLGLQPGDLASLKSFLLSEGMENQDVEALEKAVKADGKSIGPRVREWIGGISMKMGTTALEIGKGLTVQVVLAAIKSHYNIK